MRAYLQTSGVLFGLIAVGHLYRVFRHWPADLAGHVVPLWFSWLGLVLSWGTESLGAATAAGDAEPRTVTLG
jgi:hypothetical protein